MKDEYPFKGTKISPNTQILEEGKNGQHAKSKVIGGADVYENDEMIDYFMDDIDEMSICEGSRHS